MDELQLINAQEALRGRITGRRPLRLWVPM